MSRTKILGFTLTQSVAALTALCALFAVTPLHAIPGQPGTLDTSFGTAGKVITSVGNDDVARALALQPDGKLVLAGYCYYSTNYDFCALRYNGNGSLDASFGTAGTVITPVGSGGDFANALALQPDGKLVLAGRCLNSGNYDFCALRYHPNGTLDTSFGTAGKVITPVGSGDDYAQALAVQPDGKLVIAGTCWNGASNNFCALRYLVNGSIDASFGTAGTVITPVASIDDSAYAIALQPDGKLVLAGSCQNGADNNFCALRYNTNGKLDEGFGAAGTVTTPMGSNDSSALTLALQPDGKLVLAGRCVNGVNYDFCALRYHSNGTLDAGFNAAGTLPGTVITAVGKEYDIANALALQPDGKLVLSGDCYNGAIVDFCALRYHSDGTLDASYGTAGKVITTVGISGGFANAVALQPDGKLVLAGNCLNGGEYDFCAIRYDGGPFGYQNCKLDIDGDNKMTATIDGLISTRVMLGLTGNAVIGGISFPANATRTTWLDIRNYLVTQCGMSLP